MLHSDEVASNVVNEKVIEKRAKSKKPKTSGGNQAGDVTSKVGDHDDLLDEELPDADVERESVESDDDNFGQVRV